jgi:hypothetical protein
LTPTLWIAAIRLQVARRKADSPFTFEAAGAMRSRSDAVEIVTGIARFLSAVTRPGLASNDRRRRRRRRRRAMAVFSACSDADKIQQSYANDVLSCLSHGRHKMILCRLTFVWCASRAPLDFFTSRLGGG